MKSALLSIALVSSPMMVAQYDVNLESMHIEVQRHSDSDKKDAIEQQDISQKEECEEDAFDDLMDTDVPSDMIVEPKPVSACEAYLKQIGVQVLMKYITFKIWLEHQWQSITKHTLHNVYVKQA